ncbi:hypothetical protein PENTCL1PPCAC_27407, partial [Pristionchus entomophagus]
CCERQSSMVSSRLLSNRDNITSNKQPSVSITCLGLDGELSGDELSSLSKLLGRLEGSLVGGEGATHSTGLLVPDVGGKVLLSLKELSQLLLLGLVDDGQNASDVLADDSDLGELGSGSTSDLGDLETGKLGLLLLEGLEKSLLGLSAELSSLSLHFA